MDFAILGPLRVTGPHGPVELGAPKQRAILAVLLLAHRDDAVPAGRLVDEVWGAAPPATAAKALQVHVSQLRRALGPEQPIVTRPSGYGIRVEPGQLDLARFEALAAEARAARGAGDGLRAADRWREALALFRGPPLADVPLQGPAAAEAARLAELRLAALEERIALDLDLGEHHALAAELEALVSEHPYRERLHAQLMLALYRSGRQADALDAFRRARRALVDDLGIEPGRELHQLEAAVLAQDPALDPPSRGARAPSPPAARLPEPPALAAPLLGREDELATASALLADPAVRLLTLTGPGGIGKTTLALELARREGPRFADGACFVALAAVDAPGRVVPEIAHALGLPDDDAEALAGFLAERALLLIADNLEHLLDAAPDLGRGVVAAPLLGREDELATASALLADPAVRLLTLTGPGGIGKTTLALELARREGPRFADGACFVALAAVGAPGRVVPEIAHALGVPDDDAEALAGFLAERALLLIVDNLEHLLDAAPDLGRVLAASPRSKLVATSRAPLRLAGEHELAVPPLPRAAAVELFLGRARALDPRLELGPDDEDRVETICGRLDGLPLAIELAAARTKVLSPAAMLDRLEHRLDLLSAGPRDAPARQRTLRAAIDWSHDLLDADAQRLFAELGVFVGGWTLDAAEAVCGAGALDGIAALVDQSLVTRDGDRYGMLESIRAYAVDRLTATGGLEDARRRHARAFAALVEGAEEEIQGPGQSRWFARLEADVENLRAATAWALEDGDADTALGLAGGLWRFWVTRGWMTERRGAVAAALAMEGGRPELRLTALNAAGVMAGEAGDFAAARARFTEALALARELGDRRRLAGVESNLGVLAVYAGDHQEAVRRYEASTAIWRELGDAYRLSLMTQNLGLAHDGAGRRERAIALLEESVALGRRAGDPVHLASTMRSLARVLLAAGAGRDRAVGLLREALTRAREIGDRPGVIESLETAAGEAARAGEPRTGALLVGAAEAGRAEAGSIRQPDETAWVDATMAALRAALGDAAFEAALAEGRALSLEAATERALAVG